MKKAYNVYSILGKTVSKAAMLTMMFALCFLFSGQMIGQTPAGPRTGSTGVQTDYEAHMGTPIPFNALTDNLDRLDSELIKNENAMEIAYDLFNAHKATFNATASVTQEMEYELRRVFLEALASNLKGEADFSSAFSTGLIRITEQMSAYDASQYNGPTTKAIAEGYITNFF